MSGLEALARHVVAGYGTIAFCSFIAVGAVATYILGFRRGTSLLINQLGEALDKLRSLPEIQGFVSRFSEFDKWMGQHSVLHHLWKESRKTLVFPSPTSKEQLLYSTAEAASSFSEGSIIASRMNLRFYNAFPNYLTGAGILGTFIGLVAGIYLASKGLASDDPKEMYRSLQSLLDGASLAFWTSIVGISTSILFSWREKAVTHKLHSLVSNWNEELDRRIQRITPEDLARKQLQQLERQTDYLEEFTTKVAFNIADALGDRMNERLVPALDKLTETVDGMRRERGDSNEELLRQMVGKFTETMSGAAGKEMTALSNTLDGLNKTLTPLIVEMKEAHQRMQGAAAFIAEQIGHSYDKSSKEFAESVKAAITQLREGFSQTGSMINEELKAAFDRAVERLESTVAALDKSIGNLGRAGKDTEDMAAKTSAMLDRFDAAAQKLADIQGQMESASKTFERTAKSVEAGGNATRDTMAQVTNSLEGMKSALGEFRTVQQRLQAAWETYEKRFENLDAALEKVFAQMDRGLKAYAEATRKYMAEMDGHTRSVTELFGAAVKEFGESVQDLAEVQSRGRG